MSSLEWDLLMDTIKPDTAQSNKFWATAELIHLLSDWGVGVSVFLQQCPCLHHKTNKERASCNLKGRRAINLSSGAWNTFLNLLSSIKIPTECRALLQKLDAETTTALLHSFSNCKEQMMFRGKQAWSFWDQLPYAMISRAEHLVTEDTATEDGSRQKAKQLLSEYDSCAAKSTNGELALFWTQSITANPTSQAESRLAAGFIISSSSDSMFNRFVTQVPFELTVNT